MSLLKCKWVFKNFSLILITIILLSFSSASVLADRGLVISTSYPGIEGKAGETIDFPLKIENNTSDTQEVELKISSIPDKWEWNLQGNGRTVNKVIVDNDSSVNVSLGVSIPSDAKEGNYKIIVQAKGASISDSLTLDISLKELTKQDSKLTAEYPDLEGTPSTNFKYRVNLTNNSSTTQSYSLEANLPRGWQATFSPASSSEKIASISVDPNRNQGIDINIDPPDQVTAGEYTVPIVAKSAEETLKLDLKVIIKGTYDIELSTPTGKLSDTVYAGKEKGIKLAISNTGSTDLENVTLSSWEPNNWEVTFEPKEIDVLKAGETKEVIAKIKSDSKALVGDYVVRLTARTPEDSSTQEFRITVKTSTTWGIIGILIIVGLVVGLYYIFKKYGRR
ncbi:hypothetical protein DW1_0975 [Proteiniborus sp. DW1]|uniref:COG1470 family protein n=1 Tax=Proteiniborus sp. DW1 TaxID=1889883 RepID=UPI00092E1A09|nr:NEW3 domain-containing protein [Proteiniborus sp. DW1]SCG82582.1 hypothetical protein DW1_0975 [Proteiniborus sp. DW1]